MVDMRALAITPRPSSLAMRGDKIAVGNAAGRRPNRSRARRQGFGMIEERSSGVSLLIGGRLSSASALTLTAWVRDVSPRILGTSSFATEMAGMPRHVRDERLETREILHPVTILPPSRANSVTST